MPTNPNPEGLPSLKLPGGYHLRKGTGCWLLCDPKGNVMADLFEREAKPLAAAMNVHTDALGAALEKIAANSDEDNEWDAVDKLHENKATARAALEAWGKGR